MNIISVRFLLLVVVGLFLFHSFRSLNWRRFILLLMNAVFVASFAKSPADLLPLAGFLCLGYFFIVAIHARPTRMNFVCGIIGLVVAFVYLKKYTIVGPLTLKISYVTMGLSFIFFRMMQIFIDTYQKALVERVSPWEMLNYCCQFLTFVSGPIQRFQEYQEQESNLASLSISSETAYSAFSRIANGIIKLALVSVAFEWSFQWIGSYRGTGYPWATYAGECLCYLLQLYYNFSGYMDIVIGVGFLFGFQLPENFDDPLNSENFLNLWSRWHITLSEWLKLYLFNPFVKALTHRWMNMSLVPYYGVAGYFITFFVMGVWHGTTFMFVIYGLFLGLGVAMNKLYEVEMRSVLGKKRFKRIRGNAFYQIFAQSLTLTYFAIALTALWMDWGGFKNVLSQLGPLGVLESTALSLAVVAVLRSVYSLGRTALVPVREHLQTVRQTFFLQQMHLAARVMILILFFASAQFSMPRLIYGGF